MMGITLLSWVWRAVSLELAWEPLGVIVVDGAEVIVAVNSLPVAVIVAVDDPEDVAEPLSLLLVELVKGLEVPDEEMELEVLEICTSVVLEAVSDANEVLLLLLLPERTLDELERVTAVPISPEKEDSGGAVSTVVEVLDIG